ncbi:MAG: hypothetical protein M0R38_00010 [Bacteroidia bacterium]|nr:hypothetical protein [Bacteroidia bacterium]
MKGNYEISIVLTVLSFGLPVLYFILTRKAFTPFSLRQLIKGFNFALIVQIILAGFYLGLMGFMDKKIYAEGQSTDFTDILMNTGMTYTIVGAFFYIPGLILLNLVSFLISRLTTK